MFYRPLGNTGMVTSVFGFGFWATFGVKDSLLERDGIDQAKKILKIARNGGINFFDNAETYGNPQGEAERIFGCAYSELVKEDPQLWDRSDVLITTKLRWGGKGLNQQGLSRKHLVEGMDASLKRLQMDYVDIIYCHRPDSLIPTETAVRAMTQLVRDGKAMCWGTSEWTAQQITEAYWLAQTLGLEPPMIEQPQHHMFHREKVENEYYPLYKSPYNLGITSWSPLASGLLTGKYNNGAMPDDSRAKQSGYGWIQSIIDQWEQDGKLAKVQQLEDYAKDKIGCTIVELALAWCIKSNPNISCILLGATKESQIESNLKAIEVMAKLTDDHLEEIEKILDNKPDGWWGHGFRKIDPTI